MRTTAHLRNIHVWPSTLSHCSSAGLDEPFLLVVVGEFNSGKSTVINALLGEALLEEGILPTTNEISVLKHIEKGGKASTERVRPQTERHSVERRADVAASHLDLLPCIQVHCLALQESAASLHWM